MTNSNNKQAVAVKTRVNAGITPRDAHSGLASLTLNHNETVAVKTQVNAVEFLHPDTRTQ